MNIHKTIVYTKEIYEKANKANKELLKDYLVELKSKKRKPNTLEQYLSDGRMLICYVANEMENKSFLDFNKKDFRQVSLWLTEDRQVSNARFNRVFALIHGMMEYAEDEEDYEYEKNYARKIKNLPKEPVKKITFLTDIQISKIRGYLLEHKMYRECAYLDISYDSAARINEVIQMKKQDLVDNRYSNTVVGKRGKQFNLIIHDHSIESLRLYLEQRGEDHKEELWVSVRRKDHKVVGKQAAYEWTKKMCKILTELEGKPITFSPHCFRHSALENYENGTHYMCRVLAEPKKFSLEELRVLAHHDSMDTTKSYLKPKENNVIEGMFGVKIS
ncbi:integrase [Sporanaerobium hydrogeniformans]|uniref:Integrase n=1 Tax=Sporanaerobium hydrogeniformans TaxID=3072179 RepID=A0AC61D8W7_9FIRM|nr:site-specific integrase [Sporanaerobium hydrogeniformans]PHV69220.1 integrase [Sporanaerobium hydrogeniformans]